MEEQRRRDLDARSLRGLAHPLRVRLLGMLRAEGPATATGLAERVGERSGTTSWHLRQLAEHGFIEEDTDRGNRRERWWRASQDVTVLDPARFVGDPETRGALNAYLHEVLATGYHKAAEYLAEIDRWEPQWVRASALSDVLLALNADELAGLVRQLHSLLEWYRREPREGDEQVLVQFQAFPRRTAG